MFYIFDYLSYRVIVEDVVCPFLFLQDHVNSNSSVRREPASKDVSGLGKKDTMRSTKKAGTSLALSVISQHSSSVGITAKFCSYLYFFEIHLDKGKTAKEEARELQLREEACVREKVLVLQKNLSLMLKALGEMAMANPVFAHSELPSLVSLA